VDYDGDGILDLLAHHSRTSMGITGRLYRGNGDGTLKFITSIPQDPCEANSVVWSDYDGDGDPDLFVPQGWARPDYVYRNEGNGSFSLITTGLLVNSPGNSRNPAWGDYDNDGDLDLALTKSGGTPVLLRNDGTNFSYGPTLPPAAGSPVWFDYDNDGLLDLFFVQGQGTSKQNVLVRNNGDGTFTSMSSAITADWGGWTGASCGDFDNDGFMDMFVTSSTGQTALYRNLGNTNHWIKFKLVGTASNRDAFGAKVRVLATVRGQSVWQMREVSSGNYFQDEPRPNFGLGDAAIVEKVRIEWPSGIVQTLTNLTAGQILTVEEHQEYGGPLPALANTATSANGLQFSITEPAVAAVYTVEASTNLVTWTKLMARRSAGGTFGFTDTGTTNYPSRFYRVVVP
jgi:enediyne biosynthesis protein E4